MSDGLKPTVIAGWNQPASLSAEAAQAVSHPEPGPGHVWFSQASRDVLAERRRQIEAEGFDCAQDDRYRRGELVAAALTLGTRVVVSLKMLDRGASQQEVDTALARHGVPQTWPFHSRWWKPHSLRRCLVIAAALLIAEIERLDRKAERS